MVPTGVKHDGGPEDDKSTVYDTTCHLRQPANKKHDLGFIALRQVL